MLEMPAGGKMKKEAKRWACRLAAIAGAASFFLGFTVIAGWHLRIPSLIQVFPRFVPMQYNTALGFVFCGLGLCAGAAGKRTIALPCAWAASAIGLLTLGEYLTGLNLGLDQLLMEHYITVQTSTPGRMAPNTALCFSLEGWGIACSANREPEDWRAPLLGAVVGALGVVALAGYLAGLEAAYGWGNLTRMAVHTASGFAVLGVGLILLGWGRGRSMVPAWTPSLALVGGLTVSLCLWQALEAQERRVLRQRVEIHRQLVQESIDVHLLHAREATQRVVGLSTGPDGKRMEESLGYLPGFRSIHGFDGEGHLRGEPPRGRLYPSLERLYRNRRTGAETSTILTGTLSGRSHLLIMVPKQDGGMVVAIFEPQPLLEYALASTPVGFGVRLKVKGREFFLRPPPGETEHVVWRGEAVELQGLTWNLELAPSAAVANGVESALPEWSLATGILTSLLLALLLALFRRTAREVAVRRQAQAEQAHLNQDLEEEVARAARAAVDLTRANHRLRLVNEELEQFAYVASHDLQEPLRGLTRCLQLLEQDHLDQLDEQARQWLRYALADGHRMKRLIEDLLTLCRVETRALPAEPTDSQDALEKALENLKEARRETRARLTYDPLPVVKADQAQLVQLFQNLLGNALKFRGTRRPEIHVQSTPEGQSYRFSVRDNGIGIESEDCDKIFTIFQRLHAHDRYPGTGIGLAICKKIVDRHGGVLGAESVPGGGSTFFFTLPAPDRTTEGVDRGIPAKDRSPLG